MEIAIAIILVCLASVAAFVMAVQASYWKWKYNLEVEDYEELESEHEALKRKVRVLFYACIDEDEMPQMVQDAIEAEVENQMQAFREAGE